MKPTFFLPTIRVVSISLVLFVLAGLFKIEADGWYGSGPVMAKVFFTL